MKMLSIIWILFAISHLDADEFKEPETSPDLVLKDVSLDAKSPDCLLITFDFKASGKGHVSLRQDQFWILIDTPEEVYLFEGEAIFEEATPKIIDVTDKNGTTLKVRCRQSKGEKKENWNGLPAGNYHIQVRVYSGKALEFDYHWRGQTYSNKKILTLPMQNKPALPIPATAPPLKPEGSQKPQPKSEGRFR